jgi:hypothetical protein
MSVGLQCSPHLHSLAVDTGRYCFPNSRTVAVSNVSMCAAAVPYLSPYLHAGFPGAHLLQRAILTLRISSFFKMGSLKTAGQLTVDLSVRRLSWSTLYALLTAGALGQSGCFAPTAGPPSHDPRSLVPHPLPICFGAYEVITSHRSKTPA